MAIVAHQLAHLAEDMDHDGERGRALSSPTLVAQFEAIGDAMGRRLLAALPRLVVVDGQPRLRARHFPSDTGPGDLSTPG